MSTKIYNAYIFDKNYSFYEIRTMLDAVRNDVAKLVHEAKSRYITQEFVHMHDFLNYFGLEKAQTQYDNFAVSADKSKRRSDKIMENAWRMICANHAYTKTLQVYLGEYFNEKAYEDSKSNFAIDFEFDYNCEVVLFPLKDKTLLMYFGNSDLRKVVDNLPYLSDYHYQNQTDKPENVSEEEWNQRKKDWDEALSRDGIPTKHGLTVKLFDCEYDLVGMSEPELREDDVPSLEERAKWLLDYMGDYPNPPKGGYSVEWVRYLRSPEYLEWREKRLGEIQEKLKDMPVSLNVW